MADKLGKLMQVLEDGKTKEGRATQATTALGKSKPKMDVKHTWKTSAFGTIGSPRAKKRGSGKH